MRYTTPAGNFPSLREASKAHGLTKEGARLRFKSIYRPDWIDSQRNNSDKVDAIRMPGRPRIHPPVEKRTPGSPTKRHGLKGRTWTVSTTENMGKDKRKSVKTPLGQFDSIREAAQAHGISENLMAYRIKVAGSKYQDYCFVQTEMEMA